MNITHIKYITQKKNPNESPKMKKTHNTTETLNKVHVNSHC